MSSVFWVPRVTLTYHGVADQVHLVTWMPRFPAPPAFTRVGPDSWALDLNLPATARIEYKLAVVHDGRVTEIEDPLNPPVAGNPFGTNSVLTGPDYRLPRYVSDPPSPPRGQLHEIRVPSSSLDGRRHHHVYLPEGFTTGADLPVVFVHDGTDFLRYADLAGSVDRLIADGAVAPLVLILLDPWRRIEEYGASQAHSQHIVEEVLPHAIRRLRLRPRALVSMGSSLGAVAALASAWHYPDRFVGVACLSGSFASELDEEWPEEVFRPITDFLAAFEADPRLDGVAVFQSVGRYEGVCDYNRRLAPLLGFASARHRYVETWDGHHWGSWRDRLGEALSFLMPGPGRAIDNGGATGHGRDIG